MHQVVHSPLKSKWNTFKTWIKPDLNKRRPSQCSTTSTNSTHSTSSSFSTHEPHTKRPSLTGSEGLGIMVDKCISSFRRRPSNASEPILDLEKETEHVYSLYNLAMDELNYAEDSRGSAYYSGDRIAAKEAIEFCEKAYSELVSNSIEDEDYLSHLESTIGFKISTLRSKFYSLPLQDDQVSF